MDRMERLLVICQEIIGSRNKRGQIKMMCVSHVTFVEHQKGAFAYLYLFTT